jgi:hypothetical protein
MLAERLMETIARLSFDLTNGTAAVCHSDHTVLSALQEVYMTYICYKTASNTPKSNINFELTNCQMGVQKPNCPGADSLLDIADCGQ